MIMIDQLINMLIYKSTDLKKDKLDLLIFT